MTALKERISLTSFDLKLIAIITMTIDHVGAGLFPYANLGGVAYLRVIGRLAFPIFCFLIVEGFFHTRDIKKYMFRLMIFALLSEVPFDMLFNPTGNVWVMQNIFCTLFLGLVAIYLMDLAKEKWGQYTSSTSLAQIIVVLVFGIIAYLAKVDYGELGIAYLVIFYLYRGRNLQLFLVLIAINILFGGVNIQIVSVLAVPILACYNGKLGPKAKYLFYVYYPLHIAVITGIYVYMNGYIPGTLPTF